MANGIILIMVYGIIAIISYWLIKQNYIAYSKKTELGLDKAVKLKIPIICLISILFAWVNWFATNVLSKNVLGSDRLNYSVEFLGSRSVQSTGLQFIFDVVKRCGGDIYTVFYITTFITVFITLIAYRRSKLTSPKIIVLLLVSEYVFFTFTGLKQSYTAAFSFLFFVNAVEDKSKKGTILSIIDIILSIIFHSAGYILIPLFVILRFNRDNKRKFYFYVAIASLSLLLLPNIMQFISSHFGAYVPLLSFKIDKYFGEATGGLDSQWSAIIKYLPFFYVSVWGIANRKKFKRDIAEFDSLLLITVVGSLVVLYSIYSYWFQRFRYSFYFPVFLLYELMDRNDELKGNRVINDTIVIGGSLLVTVRKIILIFKNFGAF